MGQCQPEERGSEEKPGTQVPQWDGIHCFEGRDMIWGEGPFPEEARQGQGG